MGANSDQSITWDSNNFIIVKLPCYYSDCYLNSFDSLKMLPDRVYFFILFRFLYAMFMFVYIEN